jgi:hypothetical protein
VCFRGGKAPTRRNLGAASLISFVMASHGGHGRRPGHGTVSVLVDGSAQSPGSDVKLDKKVESSST